MIIHAQPFAPSFTWREPMSHFRAWDARNLMRKRMRFSL